jgi:hypothetical protein
MSRYSRIDPHTSCLEIRGLLNTVVLLDKSEQRWHYIEVNQSRKTMSRHRRRRNYYHTTSYYRNGMSEYERYLDDLRLARTSRQIILSDLEKRILLVLSIVFIGGGTLLANLDDLDLPTYTPPTQNTQLTK